MKAGCQEKKRTNKWKKKVMQEGGENGEWKRDVNKILSLKIKFDLR